MLNEWQEFLDYTGPMTYKADREKDTTWLGRFTFEALRDFGGLSRILTILARGFLFLGSDGTALGGQPRERMAYARRGLCAWCSVPERAGAQPEWKYRTDFRSFHEQFPALVDEDGRGWFCRHFHTAMAFARDNPKMVRKAYSETAGRLDRKFDAEWRKKVRQFQMPLLSSNADAAWILRFDDVFADALELGPLRQDEMELPEELRAKIEAVRPEKLPAKVIYTLSPTMPPTGPRTVIGWCCRWRILIAASGTPILGESISARSRRRSSNGAAASASADTGCCRSFCRRQREGLNRFRLSLSLFQHGVTAAIRRPTRSSQGRGGVNPRPGVPIAPAARKGRPVRFGLTGWDARFPDTETFRSASLTCWMRFVDIVPLWILGWGAVKSAPLCGDFFDQRQFICCKACVLRRFDVIQDLLRAGGPGQYTGHDAVVQNPSQRHLRQGLAALGRQIVQCPDLVHPVLCQLIFL